MSKEKNDNSGKKFYVNIEGEEYPWPESIIKPANIRSLAGIPKDVPIIVELPDGTEKTLNENETLELKPGHRYGRSAKYRRG